MRTFELFSTPHIAVIFIFIFISVLMVIFRRSLRPHQSIIKWTLFGLLIICEVSGQIWEAATNQYEVGSLPLHLCSISTFLCLYLFLKPNKKIFYLLFFTGLLPPSLSIITPEMFYQFPHFDFLSYFLHHAAITWSVIYFIVFQGYRVPVKAIGSVFLILNLMAIPIFIINILLDTNFFYLANPTESKTILSFFGSGIMYYINLEIAAFIVFSITYVPMWMLLKREKNKRINQET
ncbi:TIGR02206 family membrane protein [Pontibacillus sp. HMF3514]|uniref:YwaF family protein n=1 Tax=Pontibacillus sp. HMF3514 TaxID=2692425 RepID=UPI001F456E37|nr:TIGR02206 family membrane protein [Pontibacillus sp. HMF3514]